MNEEMSEPFSNHHDTTAPFMHSIENDAAKERCPMAEPYPVSRVLEPKHVLPTSAWRLDNNRNIYPDEIRLSLGQIHIEGTSFKQIRTEAGEDPQRIRQKIMDIVIHRGKLHNPVTDTGGLACGIVEQIGADYPNPKGLSVGDAVLCNASLCSVPMHIDHIRSIDPVFRQLEVDGYMVASRYIDLLPIPADIPLDLLLFTFDESGTLYRLHQMVPGRSRFLVVGNSLIANLIFGYVIRREAPAAEIVCVFDRQPDVEITGGGVNVLLQQVFNEVHYLDILKPLECMEVLGRDSYFDLSVNCAEIAGAETINMLATKPGGAVLFANLINNLNICLYITESMAKPLQLYSAEGFLEGYASFDMQLVGELAPYFQEAHFELLNMEPAAAPGARRTVRSPQSEAVALLEDYVYRSHAMNQVLDEILRVAKYDCNVLLSGETGVGKEKAANIIQKNSDRKMQPFVKINCASISPNLIESEFFGYERGAFTGANSCGKKGYFEIANNGVIFLDEVGELPLEMQAKLLRVVQDGEFYRVGGERPVKTNVRIISATNRDLEDFVEKGLFRRDLYYRLNVVPIRIPSLAERPEDIPALIDHFLTKYGEKFKRHRRMDESAVEYLQKQPWPGNIRELENTVQRLVISSQGDTITLLDVMRDSHGELFHGVTPLRDVGEEPGEQEAEFYLDQAVETFEKGLIQYACDKYGSTRRAARALGISQTQIVRKKKKYGI